MYKKIEPWYEPVDLLKEKKDFVCEMSREDHGFLCGAIRDIRPQKILEIGVAEGGTTSIIKKTLGMLDIKAEFYSVDLNEEFYQNNGKKTGYECDGLEQFTEYKGSHKFLFGKTIAGQIEEIGKDIDFIIIDTTHQLPGELLDFLVVLPYCAKDAFIVLHDTNLNFYRACCKDKERVLRSHASIATKVLFTSVVADKYINYTNANIAGFRITEDTRKYISDIFYALTLSWSYFLSEWMIEEYKRLFKRHYNEEQIHCYEVAVKNHRKVLESRMIVSSEKYDGTFPTIYEFPYDKIPKDSNIVLYGAGQVGKNMHLLLELTNYCHVKGWLDKNYSSFDKEMNVESPNAIIGKAYDYILVAVEKDELYEEIKAELVDIYRCNEGNIIGPVKRYK